jgi:hypothetical protein
MWLNNAILLNFCRRKFIFELKDLIYNKKMMEDTLKNILKFNNNISIIKHLSDMNRPEQESSLKTFLTKLLNFTRRINVYQQEKI